MREKNWAFSTRFARWAVDNHKEAQGEDFDDDSIDYSRVGTATKAYPSMYDVEGANHFWQSQTETGDNSNTQHMIVRTQKRKRITLGGNMTLTWRLVDWGDTDDHDLTIDDVAHHIAKYYKLKKVMYLVKDY